jgi:hypothetical protein
LFLGVLNQQTIFLTQNQHVMKKVVFLVLITVSFIKTANSQTQCGTLSNHPNTLPGYTISNPENFDEAPFCVRVFFHIVRNSAGTNGINVTRIPFILDQLNERFNPHNILIVNAGQDFINNDTYGLEFNDGEFNSLVAIQNNSTSVNFYLLPVNPLEYAGRASAIPGNSLVVGRDFIETSTSPHELGHCLNLFHTHHQLEQSGCTENASNCSTCGDFVCDTPVDPLLSCGGNVNQTTCEYTGGGGFTPDTRNIMSYSCRAICRNRFSFGQANRIRTSLLYDPMLKNFATTTCITVQGSATLCNNETYSIQNAPAGAIYDWSINNTSVATISGANNQATVTVNRLADGQVTLRCDMLFPNGGSLFVTRDLIIGKPTFQSGDYSYQGNSYPLLIDWNADGTALNPTCNLYTTFVNMDFKGNNSTVWTRLFSIPASPAPSWSQNGDSMNFYSFSINQINSFRVAASNGCGVTVYNFSFKSNNCSTTGDPCGSIFQVSPIPANDMLKIEMKPAPCSFQASTAAKQAPTGLKKIRIIDIYGATKFMQSLSGNKTDSYNISLPSLKAGVYVLELIHTYGNERKTIVINQK